MNILSCDQIENYYNMVEIEKEVMEFLWYATLWLGNLHKVAAPYLLSIYLHCSAV